ncbi:MAG: hypothetical protein HRT35_25205 [Algicola sp.]|nr:hypothetical protein [Algicola sp.]
MKTIAYLSLVTLCLLIHSCGFAQATTNINMLAPDRIKSYQKGGITYQSIADFFEQLPQYSVKYHYVDFAQGWKLIAKGEDYCHFFAVYWPTDKNVVRSKKLTLRMRSPKILINKSTLTNNDFKPPYNSKEILRTKNLVGAMIRDHRFEYQLHQWLSTQIAEESDHFIASDFSVDQMYMMFGKNRVDYLITSPDTTLIMAPKPRKKIEYIPLTQDQKPYYHMQIVCTSNDKNRRFVEVADANMALLYNNPNWRQLWSFIHFHQKDWGKKALEDFIKQNQR